MSKQIIEQRDVVMAQALADYQTDATLEKIVVDMKTRRSVLLPPGATMPGRNDRCPCGSGKKFKHCCLDKYQYLTGEM